MGQDFFTSGLLAMVPVHLQGGLLRRATALVAVVWIGTIPASGQDSNFSADTLKTTGVVLLDPGIALGRPTLVFPPSYQPGPLILSSRFTSPLAGVPPFLLDPPGEPKADLLSPYLLHVQSAKKMNTLYTILGAMELGAVAYVAYRHVRKQGF